MDIIFIYTRFDSFNTYRSMTELTATEATYNAVISFDEFMVNGRIINRDILAVMTIIIARLIFDTICNLRT